MQIIDRIYTERTKAPNLAQSYLRVYLTILGPVPVRISFPFAGTEGKLKITKTDIAWLPSRNGKIRFSAKESMKPYQDYLNSIKISETALKPHLIFIYNKK